jgi:hypothetical protein
LRFINRAIGSFYRIDSWSFPSGKQGFEAVGFQADASATSVAMASPISQRWPPPNHMPRPAIAVDRVRWPSSRSLP